MSTTPDRRNDRATLSRRILDSNSPAQQYTSPFRHAFGEHRAIGRSDASKIPSPSQTSSARRRRASSQTGTLRGAFEAISRRHPPSMAETKPYSLGSPEPSRRNSIFDPTSPTSNPPDELLKAYRQIDDAGSLIDQDEIEDDNFRVRLERLRNSRGRSSSSGSAMRDDGGLFSTDHDAGFLNDITDESLRRTLVDHVQDEQRLRRATSSDSPVLNRSGTMPALTSENLQRREEEAARNMAEEAVEEDYDDGPKLNLNLPRTWGSRGTRQKDWLRNMTRRSDPETGGAAENSKDVSPQKPKFELDSHVRFTEHTRTRDQNSAETRAANVFGRYPLSDAHNRLASEPKEDKPATGSHIPNTPITVYQNSTFNRRSPTKRDSHDLLRRLSRTESPGQNLGELRTPEAQKIPGTRIYDKTPVVTGAWIDTPVTERPARLDPVSRNTIPSPAKRTTASSFRSTSQPQITEESEPDEPQRQHNFEAGKKQERQVEEAKEDKVEKPSHLGQDNEERSLDHKGTELERNEESQKRQHEKNAKDKKRPPLIKPDLPKSALETVMQDFKANKESLDVGDDTLESLQEILNEQVNAVKTEAEDDAAYESAVLEKLERAGTDKPEKFNLDNMNQKLIDLAQNINRVKQGLDGLGDQVTSIPSPKGSPTRRTHAGDDDDRIYTLVPIPKLWKRTPSGRTRPTRLGWCLIVFFVWFWSESTLCDYYCHPFIAETCERNCLHLDAPRYPYVIPTLLWRWSHLSGILTPLWTLAIAFYRLTAQLIGLSDGFVDEAPSTLNLTGVIWIRGTPYDSFPAPTGITLSSSSNSPKAWQEQNQIHNPEVVPQMNLGQDTGVKDWDDEKMDDDEYI